MNHVHKTSIFGLLKYIDTFYKQANNTEESFLDKNRSVVENIFGFEIEDLKDFEIYIDTASKHLFKDDIKIDYLNSIFEDIGVDKNKNSQFYYPMKPLTLEKSCIFPSNNKGNNIKQDLVNLYNEFYKDFAKIQKFKSTKALNFLYYLSQKYFWCIGIAEDIGVSLFDHMRLSCSIGSALADANKLDTELLLVEGDMSGIQKFIYNIAKTQGIKDFSISKALRGRSFLVSLMPEILSRYVLRTLGYSIANIIYIGGGKFQLIISNKEGNIVKLNEIEKDINHHLLKEYQTEIGFIMAYEKFSIDELNNFGHILQQIQISLDEEKKRRFGDYLVHEFKEKTELCKSCKIMSCDDDEDICKLCYQSKNIGHRIPKIDYLAFVESAGQEESSLERFYLGKFGAVYFAPHENADEVLCINNTNFDKANGFKFLGNTVPIISKENKHYFRELVKFNNFDDIDIYEHMVLPFRLLSYLATGDKKIATFRADVDNLGLIFSDFIGGTYKIARIASLSRMLDLFFSGYINKISQDITKELKSTKEELKNVELNSLIYIVYSGGDDIFAIGPYDAIFNFALRLREEFYLYTTNNLDFGLSGGIFISSNSMPIPMLASGAEHLESLSKKAIYADNNGNVYTKDSVSIFNKFFRWSSNLKNRKSFDEKIINNIRNGNVLEAIGLRSEKENSIAYFNQILEITDLVRNIFDEHSVSKSFLYRLLILSKLYVGKDRKDINPVIYPKIYYQIARNIQKEDVKNFFVDLFIIKGYKDIDKKDIMKNLDVIVSIILMKLRENKEVLV